MEDKQYIHWLTQALSRFQLIEEILKTSIGMSYQILNATSPDSIRFEVPPKDVLNAPLGRLIDRFSHVSNNTYLVAELRKITNWRNFCAHNGYSHEFLRRYGASDFSEHSYEDLRQVATVLDQIIEHLRIEEDLIRATHKLTVSK